MAPKSMSADSDPEPESDVLPRKYNVGDVLLGKYRLVSILGEGGMGEVWEAHNVPLDAPVAVKLIRADLDEGSAAQRLVQEARAAARLGHPAIVRIFDVGETRHGDPFIVMERLRGESLAAVAERQGRLPAASAVQVLLPIADALANAHIKGIVHRDIKPENIYVAEDENGELQPKLLDFGVVKLEHAETNSNLTQMGTVVGSPGYLSPEQARGSDDIDYRVDVWAFSVVLYEVITGVAPFNGGNYNALLRSIVEDEPRPTTDHAAGDGELWSIVERGLRKDRDERWPSMMEYGRALAQWALQAGVDEDVCGTGIELKWLSSSKSPGRASLVSVSFDPDEMPSAVRRARTRLPTESPPLATGPSAPALEAPEPPPPLRRHGLWLIAGALLVLGCIAAAIVLLAGEPEPDPAVAPKAAQAPTHPTHETPKSEPAKPKQAEESSKAALEDTTRSKAKAPESERVPAAPKPTRAAPPPRRAVQVAPTLAPPAPEPPPEEQPPPKKKPKPQDNDLKSPY